MKSDLVKIYSNTRKKGSVRKLIAWYNQSLCSIMKYYTSKTKIGVAALYSALPVITQDKEDLCSNNSSVIFMFSFMES